MASGGDLFAAGAFLFSAMAGRRGKMRFCRLAAALPGLCGFLAASAQAQDLGSAIREGRPVIDLRLRHEAVDDAARPMGADAVTLRARLGYETGAWNGLSLQADFDQVWALADAYDSTRNGRSARAVVADPAMTALNRLQLTYAADSATRIVLGRQRLLIGNQRFIGNSGWRQHEQTFDGVSAVNGSVPGLTLTYAWLHRVNRVWGPEVPAVSSTVPAATGQASYFKSDSHVLDGVYTGVPGLRLEAYAVLLDLAAPSYATLRAQQLAVARLSTATIGGRGEYGFALAEGVAAKLNVEFAHQRDHAANPLRIGLNYWLGEGSLTWQGVTGLAGYEVLEGDGVVGFATPLATLHAFNGWADMFLATPANGLRDFYLRLGTVIPADAVGLRSLAPTIAWHDYRSDRLDAGLGSEWNVQAELAVDANASLLAKYARYAGSGVAFGGFPDKSVFWLQASYRY